jgi:hypothetical protein
MSDRFNAPANMRVDDIIKAYDGVMSSVEAILQDKGVSADLPEPGQPEGLDQVLVYADNGDPVLPDDLTELDHVQIGKLFTYFTGWTNYVQSMVTYSEVSRDVIKTKLAALDKAVMVALQQEDGSLSDARAKAKVILDPRHIEAEVSYMEAYALAKVLHARYEQFKRSEKVISRELTRRQQELEATAQGGQRGAFRPHRGPGEGRYNNPQG